MSLVSKAKTTTLDLTSKAKNAKLDLVAYEFSGELPDESYASIDYERSVVDDRASVRRFFGDDPTWRDRYFEYLEDGHVGMVLHDDGEVMSYGWILTPASTRAPRALPDSICEEDCYWLFDAGTEPAYRGNGLFKEINRVRTEWILERDPGAAIYTDTGVDNVARYGIESSEFEPRGTISLVRFELPGTPLWKWSRWDRDAEHPPMPE